MGIWWLSDETGLTQCLRNSWSTPIPAFAMVPYIFILWGSPSAEVYPGPDDQCCLPSCWNDIESHAILSTCRWPLNTYLIGCRQKISAGRRDYHQGRESLRALLHRAEFLAMQTPPAAMSKQDALFHWTVARFLRLPSLSSPHNTAKTSVEVCQNWKIGN